MSDENRTSVLAGAERAELERVADEEFERRIFRRAVLIVLFVAAVIAARALLV